VTTPEHIDDSAVIDVLRAAAPDAALESLPSVDMPTIAVGREHLLAVCQTLRDDPSLQFSLLADVTAVDRLPEEPRFEVVYHLASLGTAFAQPGGPAPARRLRLKVRITADEAWVPSVVSIWPTANWTEREVFDLFGVAFEGHPDLRRVLMPEDWQGHPLRKDYPVQIRKDTASWSPLQVSVEEFTETMRRRREQSDFEARSDRTDDA
jgi:NADH-quinone oxidoreductase subunit C